MFKSSLVLIVIAVANLAFGNVLVGFALLALAVAAATV